MSDFITHLNATIDADGNLNAACAEQSRANEIAEQLRTDPRVRERVAHKAAQAERSRWQSNERSALAKQFEAGQSSLDFGDMDLEVKVPLGDNAFVLLGSMDATRIQLRREMRTESHRDENRAYESEMAFWDRALKLLEPGKTLQEVAK